MEGTPVSNPIASRNGLSLGDSLNSVGLFRGVDDKLRRQLIECAEPRRYRRGELLYREREESQELLLLMSGTAVLFRSRCGRRATLTVVRAPGVLGEEALADAIPRTASAEAFIESFALALPAPTLTLAMRRHPAIGGAARRWLAERVDQITEQRADDILLDLPARVAKTLLHLAERNGRPPLVIEANQRLVAALAGGSRQSVNQALKQFAGRGWVRLEKSRIVVVDLDALSRRAGAPPELSPSDAATAARIFHSQIIHARVVADRYPVSGS